MSLQLSPEQMAALPRQQKIRLIALLKEKERRKPLWQPIKNSPQESALTSEADILFYGGAAGGGKTDLLLGCSYLNHTRSIIFRREYPQLKAIIDRSVEIFNERAKLNKSELFWTFENGKQIEFGGVQYEQDVNKYQGRPHDLKAFDEITHFTELQFRTLCGWLRSANAKQRCRVIAAGNPPTNTDGEWIIRFFAPWLDPQHANPAKPGELRWFTTLDGKDREVENGRPFEHKGEIIVPKSRTFIPARVEDNPYYMESGYKATLQSLPEPLRSKMLYGDFNTQGEDDPSQVIPTAWLLAAQERWRNTAMPNTPLSAIGVDVARGGKDKTILSPRYDNYFAEQICYSGAETKNGQDVAERVLKLISSGFGNAKTFVNIDIIGVGSSPFDMTKTLHQHTYAFNASESSAARDKSGHLGFFNKRAEWYWKLREALDPESGQQFCIPDDRELLVDLCSACWEITPRGIKIEPKDDIKKRIGRSPDKGDSLVYASAIPHNPAADWIDFYKT